MPVFPSLCSSQLKQMGLQELLLLSLVILFSQILSCGGVQEVSVFKTSHRVVNVNDHGGKDDGQDDTKAFKRAWHEACSSPTSTVLMVPEKSYLVKRVVFSGPCKSNITMMIKGTIEASSNMSDWNAKDRRHWIVFEGIQNLLVTGGGTLDGKGDVWWKNSCKINKSLPCTVAPTALTFYECKNVRLENLKIQDSQQIHISIEKCSNVEASRLTITASQNSPNTDGIHVAGTKNLFITNCVIETGDDCISIVSGTRRVLGRFIVCGPGHGISIGSLGANHSRAHVANVKMDTITLKGTMNGVRIKTWQGGHGSAKNIIFQNVLMQDVENPIIIDQNYCDSNVPCQEQKSSVAVSRVLYKNIRGTSASKVATRFDCSKHFPCHGIVLQDINIVGDGGQNTTSSCNHVSFANIGMVVPYPCS